MERSETSIDVKMVRLPYPYICIVFWLIIVDGVGGWCATMEARRVCECVRDSACSAEAAAVYRLGVEQGHAYGQLYSFVIYIYVYVINEFFCRFNGCPFKPQEATEPDCDSPRSKKLLEWELSLDARDLRSHAWYHGRVSRPKAEQIVAQRDGDFLVRDCSSQPGNYVLTCRSKGQILHFVINKVNNNNILIYLEYPRHYCSFPATRVYRVNLSHCTILRLGSQYSPSPPSFPQRGKMVSTENVICVRSRNTCAISTRET